VVLVVVVVVAMIVDIFGFKESVSAVIGVGNGAVQAYSGIEFSFSAKSVSTKKKRIV